MDAFVGIDLGTSAVKVMAVDERGRALALSERRYPIHYPRAGFAEQSPQDWWKQTAAAISAVMSHDGLEDKTVRAIGLSGQMHGLVMVGRSGEPLRNAIIWPDRRTAEICAEWSRAGYGERFHSATGLPLATGFFGPSLEWVRRHEPEIYEGTEAALLPKDFLRLKLTSTISTDPSDASGTYLFDIAERSWSTSILEVLEIDDALLPNLSETFSIAGGVSPEAAEETGLRAGTPVAVGGSDQAMAAVALGLGTAGQVAVAVSTGGTIITPVEKPIVDRRLHTLCHAYRDRWLLMGATLSAGAALSWFAENILEVAASGGEPDRSAESASASGSRAAIEQLGARASAVSPGSDGLFFLPYLSGERTPHMNANAQGSFVGLTLSHTSAHLFRAIMEGVTYSLCDSVDIFREIGLPVKQALCYAGGSRSALWREIIAEVFGCPAHWRRFSDYSAMGAALTAAIAVGRPMEAEALEGAEEDLRVPHEEIVEAYRKRRATFKRLYAGLAPVFDEVAAYRT